MSETSDTERKYLPPSQHKLRRARERGQVMSSELFVGSIGFVAVLTGLALLWPEFARLLVGLFETVTDRGSASGEADILVALYRTAQIVFLIVGTVLGLGSVAAVIANVVHKGVPFSTHPISPRFDRINPASGAKRMIELRTWLEMGAGLLRLLIAFAAIGLATYLLLPSILRSAECGLHCQFQLVAKILTIVILIAALVVLVAGITDLPLQQFLFRHQMRMGKSEARRDHKESQGDPVMRTARRDRGRALLDASVAAAGGEKKASLVLWSGGIAVALRYDVTDYPVPMVVAKGRGDNAVRIVTSARTLDIPVEENESLAKLLHGEVPLGSTVAKRHFDAVAMALVRNRKT